MVSGADRRSIDRPDTTQPAKKQKTNHTNSDESAFLDHLFDSTSVAQQRQQYAQSKPYKHSIFTALFEPELLQRVQDEIIGELTFSEKETDIYKVCCLHF